MRRIISNTLIILGTLLIICIVTVNVRDILQSVKSVEEFKQQKDTENITIESLMPVVERDDELLNTDNAVNMVTDENDNTEDDITYVKKEAGELVCLLRIPKISLEEAVREGDSRDVLSSALCHLEDTSYPGDKGNCCISGHRNYTFGKYFNRLEEVTIGDVIELETYDKIYKYQVYETLVVTPDDVKVLDSANAKTLTLITCTPIFVGTHRFIVKAILVE